jgi:hypothetical protein
MSGSGIARKCNRFNRATPIVAGPGTLCSSPVPADKRSDRQNSRLPRPRPIRPPREILAHLKPLQKGTASPPARSFLLSGWEECASGNSGQLSVRCERTAVIDELSILRPDLPSRPCVCSQRKVQRPNHPTRTFDTETRTIISTFSQSRCSSSHRENVWRPIQIEQRRNLSF